MSSMGIFGSRWRSAELAVPVKYVDLSEEEALTLATLDPIAGMAAAAKVALELLLVDVHPADAAVQGMLADLASDAGIALTKEGLTDADAVPEAPAEPVSRRGDVWQLGDHRVMCGDSADSGDVSRLVAGETERRPIANDDLGDDQAAFWTAAFSPWPLEGDAYAFSPAGASDLHPVRLHRGGWHRAPSMADLGQAAIVPGPLPLSLSPRAHFYGWKGRTSYRGSRTEDSVWEVDRPMKSPDHPTAKPVALCERAIGNSSTVASLVIDPFLGSGTTVIAAERTGRRCYGMEIDPHYCRIVTPGSPFSVIKSCRGSPTYQWLQTG